VFGFTHNAQGCLALTPDASTRTAKLVKWVVEHLTNVLLVVSICIMPSVETPSVENLPL